MNIEENWSHIKNIFNASFRSSLHFSIATVTEDGKPHVTPIGSLIPGNPGQAIYFEKFTQNLPKNFKTNQQVCVLAVNSNRWFWLKSLILGHFSNPPAVRLYGTVGELRKATPTEINLWKKRVKPVSFTKGHRLMWRDMPMVRDIQFEKIQPVNIGKMTANSW